MAKTLKEHKEYCVEMLQELLDMTEDARKIHQKILDTTARATEERRQSGDLALVWKINEPSVYQEFSKKYTRAAYDHVEAMSALAFAADSVVEAFLRAPEEQAKIYARNN